MHQLTSVHTIAQTVMANLSRRLGLSSHKPRKNICNGQIRENESNAIKMYYFISKITSYILPSSPSCGGPEVWYIHLGSQFPLCSDQKLRKEFESRRRHAEYNKIHGLPESLRGSSLYRRLLPSWIFLVHNKSCACVCNCMHQNDKAEVTTTDRCGKWVVCDMKTKQGKPATAHFKEITLVLFNEC